MKFKVSDSGGNFLRVREGAYLRIRDIQGITVGVPGDDGKVMHDDTVFVHLPHGSGAAFDACGSHEEAVTMADQLITVLEQNLLLG